ncbi:MAG TPA: TIGR02266 family protein [Myxococcaceae bacterium]|nr:TIGR02266 family protein [Myxococcaceae bacterium]
MRLRNSAVPGVDPVSAPDAAAAADALAKSIELLNAEVRALSDRAARLHQAGHAEAEWLLARFQMHRLACPDLSGPAVRMMIQATFSALEEHREGLARDAAELERVEAAAEQARAEQARAEQARAEEARRAEAARKEAEQARARREAQAAERRSAPATTKPRSAAQPLGKMSAPAAAAPGRGSARIPMQTQVDMSSDSNVFTGFSTNLSEGGVFVATVNLLPVGTPVDLTFSLPGKTRITVKGEVRWTREIDDRVPDVFPGVGVRFVELGVDAAQALHKFVAEREPLFYPD